MKTRLIAAVAFTVVIVYFALAVYILPESYSRALSPPRPAPVISSVSISDDIIILGDEFSLRVSAVNLGDPADLQLISVAFPNTTRADIVTVKDHNFRQAPIFKLPGDELGGRYAGLQGKVTASYPAVEAQSRPWETDEVFIMELSIRPESEGRFVVFVKAVGLPHEGEHAHYPKDGTIDQQNEYVSVYEVRVTNA